MNRKRDRRFNDYNGSNAQAWLFRLLLKHTLKIVVKEPSMTARAPHFTLVVLVVISTIVPRGVGQQCPAADFGTPIRLGKGAVGHGDRAVEFSPDGQTLAVATSIGVSLYNVKTTSEIGRLTGSTVGGVHDVAFSPDGAILASTGVGLIELWDVKTQKNIATLIEYNRRVRSGISAIAFSPDGRTIASGDQEGRIKLWDVESGVDIATINGHGKEVSSVIFSPDGAMLASGSGDDTVKLWDVGARRSIAARFKRFVTRRHIATLRGDTGLVESVAFSPDGKILAAGSPEGVNLWDVKTKRNSGVLHGLGGKKSSWVDAVRFSPDGSILAAASADSQVILWAVHGRPSTILNASSEKVAGTFARPTVALHGHEGGVYSVAFSPDGAMLASASSGGGLNKRWKSSPPADPGWNRSVKLWALTPTPSPNVAIKRYQEIASLPEHMGPIDDIWFLADGAKIASESSGKIRLWDIETGNYLDTLPKYTNPRNPRLAVAWQDGSPPQLRETASGRVIAELQEHTGKVSAVAYSADGAILALGSNNGTVRLWEIETGRLRGILSGGMGAVTDVKFSPNGARAVTLSTAQNQSGGKVIKLWNVERGLTVATPNARVYSVRYIAFSPSGKILALPARDNTISLWNTDRGLKIAALVGHTDAVYAMAFSPDETKLASAGLKDRTVRLWEVKTGKIIAVLPHMWYVFAVAFSPDGAILASGGSGDVSLRLWDGKTGQPITALHGHGGTIRKIVFAADGGTLASASDDGTVLLWKVPALLESTE